MGVDPRPPRCAILATLLLVYGARGAARRVANSTSFPSLGLPHFVLAFDDEPLVVNFVLGRTSSSLNSSAGRPLRSDGDPWFRYTKISERGQADHPHLSNLVSTGEFRADIEAAHGQVRKRAGVVPLSWDVKLEEMARERVDYLTQNGCFIRHSPVSDLLNGPGYDYVGENLYKVVGMKPTGLDVADAWYAEIEDYTYGVVGRACTKWLCVGRRSPPCSTGHYTQMVWGRSSNLGCAVGRCPAGAAGAGDGDEPTYIAVCHYGPGGNRVSELPFTSEAAARLGHSRKPCYSNGPPPQSFWAQRNRVLRSARSARSAEARSGAAWAYRPGVVLLATLASFLRMFQPRR